MDDLPASELKKAVKLEFTKKCGRFQQILAHMGQDFITRYSTKAQPHPDFFKEDASLSHQQFTLYADQCIQAMRKYAFMETPAEILSALITSLLKVNEYLARQLYHNLKTLGPGHGPLITQTLCSSCSKMRQNQKVRALRDELNLNKTDIYVPKVIRQIVTRKGQKYDVEQLLQQQIQNLESLNEQQVRKRLGKLQIDHDKRRQEMIVCIQELARANQKVNSYSKVIDKKGKDQDKFNIKDYVFQISRHFYHNIASLEQKIKLLKQGLNPMVECQSQTQQAYVLLSLHQSMVNQNNLEISRLKSIVHDLQTQLLIQQRKNKEQVEIDTLLQEKLRKAQVQRDQLRFNSKVTETQLKGALVQYQAKTQNLQSIVKKLKTTPKLKNVDLIEQFEKEDNNRSMTTKHIITKTEINFQEDQKKVDQNISRQQKKRRKGFLTLKKPEIRDSYWNPRLMEKISIIKQQNKGNPIYINQITESIHKVYSEMHQQNKNRLKIQHIYEQSIYLTGNSSKKQLCLGKLSRERYSCCNIELKNIRDSCQDKGLSSKNTLNDGISQANQTLSRFTKKTMKRSDLKISQLEKINSIRSKQNLIFGQRETTKNMRTIETQAKQFSVLDAQKNKAQLKKSADLLKNKANFGFHQKNGTSLVKQSAKDQDFYNQKARKRRNLSQQNTLQQNGYLDNVRRSIDKLMTKDTNINLFSDQDSRNLFFFKNSQFQLKLGKKSTVYKPDSHKTVLSLEEINYSTYFYSLIAKLHLKNPVAYASLKKMLSIIPAQGSQEDGVKNSLNALIVNHRKCKGSGSICSHLQHFLEKVKNL